MKYFYLLILISTNCLYSQSITAHRGASYDAPQNSIAAFNLAWEQGSDFIEADFYLTADKKVVCFHDKTTGKLTDKNLTVETSTWDDLQKLDIGYKKNKKFKGTRMPLLSEVLKTIPEGKGIFIEIKSGIAIVPYIAEVISEATMPKENIHIISFKEDVLKKCKELMPAIKTQLLIKIKKDKKTDTANFSVEDLIKKLKNINADGIGTNFYSPMLNSESSSKFRKAGLYWNIWTINNPSEALSAKKAGLDFITTDRPQFIREKCEIKK